MLLLYMLYPTTLGKSAFMLQRSDIILVFLLVPVGSRGHLTSGAKSCGIPHVHAPPRHRRYSYMLCDFVPVVSVFVHHICTLSCISKVSVTLLLTRQDCSSLRMEIISALRVIGSICVRILR